MLRPYRVLCGGEEFDFDPAGLAAVEEFVGVDGGSEGLEIGQHGGGIDDVGTNQIYELECICGDCNCPCAR